MLKQILKKSQRSEGLPADLELSLTIVNNRGIKKINRDFRGVNQVTDVIAFSLVEGESSSKDLKYCCLGEIVISAERARQQARENNWGFYQELKLLLIHGFLHLLGYDHERGSRKAAKIMREKEKRLMRGKLSENCHSEARRAEESHFLRR